ncbi:MAG: hypothetical protein ACTS85_01055 [Arsenophonus sp. NC-PG7-MAG3]
MIIFIQHIATPIGDLDLDNLSFCLVANDDQLINNKELLPE